MLNPTPQLKFVKYNAENPIGKNILLFGKKKIKINNVTLFQTMKIYHR